MNAYTQIVVAAAAVLVAFWPQIKAGVSMLLGSMKSLASAPVVAHEADDEHVPYQTSIAYLAEVRTRLKATGMLDDARKAAIDTLTLALVEGSDQP